MRGWKMRRCAPEVRPRRTFPERCSAAEPCPGSSTTSAAQRLMTALRQDGSALRAESCAGPRTPFRSAPGFRGRAAERHFGFRGRAAERHFGFRGRAAEPDFGFRGRAAEPDFGVPGTCRGAALWDPALLSPAQDEGWESFPSSPRYPPSFRRPGPDPGSMAGWFRLLRLKILALRCATCRGRGGGACTGRNGQKTRTSSVFSCTGELECAWTQGRVASNAMPGSGRTRSPVAERAGRRP